MKKKILYIDMDGVLVDFQSGIDAYDKTYEYVKWATGRERSPVEKKAFKYINWNGRWDENPMLFGLMKPMPGAVDAFQKLSEQFDTYVLSTAPWDNPAAWQAKREWVEKHLGAAAHKRLILSHHKNLMRGDFLIDDRLANGADGFEGTHIHFGTEAYPNWESIMKWAKKEAALSHAEARAKQ